MKKIAIQSSGTPRFLRYVVTNGRAFWDGKGWAEREFALVFASFRDAANVWRKLREAAMDGTPQQQFEARVVVTVCSDGPVDVLQVSRYLEDTIRIVIDLDHEPDEFQVDVEIDWTTLTPAPQANLDPRRLAKVIYNEFKNQLGCDPDDIDAALDPNRMRLLAWKDRPACKQVWINAVARALQQTRSEQ